MPSGSSPKMFRYLSTVSGRIWKPVGPVTQPPKRLGENNQISAQSVYLVVQALNRNLPLSE